MMLEVRGLVKNFGGIRALNGVDLHLDRGELVGMIGPNGSGKTTVFNVVTGIYRPEAGGVAIEGTPIAGLAPHRINGMGIARTFQNIRLFRNLSVADNVRAGCHRHVRYGSLAALSRSDRFHAGEGELRGKVTELLELISLRDRGGEPAGNLPYGDQRRLEIARALASKPRILLLDEPAAGMNPSEVGKLMEFILEVRARFGLTILLIEHQMRLVMGICERLIVMDFGEVIARGTPDAIRKNPQVIEAYLGRRAATGNRPGGI
ncbi:MAG: ABC transporter ATP-binding protein [Deltaproteobacteria bacterium]|nr:ABC transporter ATP-binding protein [Deltaproteobacteria bacterium]